MTTDMGSEKAVAHVVLLLTISLVITHCHSTAITFPQVHNNASNYQNQTAFKTNKNPFFELKINLKPSR